MLVHYYVHGLSMQGTLLPAKAMGHEQQYCVDANLTGRRDCLQASSTKLCQYTRMVVQVCT